MPVVCDISIVRCTYLLIVVIVIIQQSTTKVNASSRVTEFRATRAFICSSLPPAAPRLNMVERFFRDLTQNGLRRGVFRDVEDVIAAIGDYIDKHK